MWKWPWGGGAIAASGGSSDDARLALEQDARTLRLELEEKERALADLRRQAERQQAGENDRVAQALDAQMERLLAVSATWITQLNTQAHLIDVEGKPVTARDVMANARGLVRILEDEGMALDSQPGEPASFDPARHEPLQAGLELEPGEPVEVRFSGVGYRGRSLRKAGVIRRRS